MKLLKDKILSDGEVLGGEVLKVDSFLNHKLDVALLSKLGEEWYNRFKDEGITSVLVSFCIPIIFSIAFLPVVYMLAVRGKYHDLFFRIKIRNNGDERDLKIRKKAILRVCGLSYKKLCKFEHGYYSEYITAIHSGNDDETLLQFIKNFKG